MREAGGQALLPSPTVGRGSARRSFFRMLAFRCARQPVGGAGAGIGTVGCGRGGLGVAAFVAGQAREGASRGRERGLPPAFFGPFLCRLG